MDNLEIKDDLVTIFLNHKKKLTSKFLTHIEVFSKLFSAFRDKECAVFEIGIGQGGSLQLWRDYFGQKARIYGIGLEGAFETLKNDLKLDHIEIFLCNQSNQDLLRKIADGIKTIDIVIDDGSHECPDQISSFETLFPYLSNRGIYLVEDTHTSYHWTHHGGYHLKTSFIEYMKNIVDMLHASEYAVKFEIAVPAFVNYINHVSFFYRNLVVVEKNVKAYAINSALRMGKEYGSA